MMYFDPVGQTVHRRLRRRPRVHMLFVVRLTVVSILVWEMDDCEDAG